jgi:hypothetical protein
MFVKSLVRGSDSRGSDSRASVTRACVVRDSIIAPRQPQQDHAEHVQSQRRQENARVHGEFGRDLSAKQKNHGEVERDQQPANQDANVHATIMASRAMLQARVRLSHRVSSRRTLCSPSPRTAVWSLNEFSRNTVPYAVVGANSMFALGQSRSLEIPSLSRPRSRASREHRSTRCCRGEACFAPPENTVSSTPAI